MLMKIKTNFGDTPPQTIKAWLHSVEAPLVEFNLRGKGAYPYDCLHARVYPDAYIYTNDRGGWVGSYQLDIQPDGSYIIK